MLRLLLATIACACALPAFAEILTYPDGARYEGQVRDRTIRHGKGILTTPRGSYDGDWRDGKGHGKGIHTWPDGTRHEGEYVDGKASGPGVKTWPGGIRYEGNFLANDPSGRGVMTWPSGQRYEGDFLAAKRHGKGVQTFADGRRYEGDWEADLVQGRGTMIWPDGRRYEGDWLSGKAHGQGTMTWPDGDRYAGTWNDSKMTGRGTYFYKRGDVYEGDFLDGERAGVGTYRYANGNVYAFRDGRQIEPEAARSRDSGSNPGSNASRTIAGAMGLSIIAGASGLSSADKVRMAGGLLSDLSGDGSGRATQQAAADLRQSRAQPAVPSVAAAQRAQPAARAADFDALLRGAPKTEKYTFTCGPHTGPDMLPADVPGSCLAEQKRHMQIQCFPGWLFDESYGALRRCAAEKSTGKFKVEHQQRLDAHREMLRREMPRCAPDGCSGRAHLGTL